MNCRKDDASSQPIIHLRVDVHNSVVIVTTTITTALLALVHSQSESSSHSSATNYKPILISIYWMRQFFAFCLRDLGLKNKPWANKNFTQRIVFSKTVKHQSHILSLSNGKITFVRRSSGCGMLFRFFSSKSTPCVFFYQKKNELGNYSYTCAKSRWMMFLLSWHNSQARHWRANCLHTLSRKKTQKIIIFSWSSHWGRTKKWLLKNNFFYLKNQ